jgi:hypothetical protein
MNDVKDLLQRALSDPRDGHYLDPASVVDLIRGRNRLRRRRTVTLAGATAAVLAVAVTPVALGGFGGTPASTQAATTPATSTQTTATTTLSSIALVSYTGKQPQGYTVDWMPKGWEIQGGDTGSLVIAPKGAKDQDRSSFIGKLVVLSQTGDAAPDTSGALTQVDGRPGYLHVEGDVQLLTYQSASSKWVVIQAPTALGWDAAQIAKFAAGVTVLKAATPGVG